MIDSPSTRVHGALEITAEPLSSAAAVSLIAALNEELSARYPEPGATHFRLEQAEVAAGSGAFLVVRAQGRPIGCGALRTLRDPSLVAELGSRVGELKRMYVAPDARGHGVGRALLDRLESAARSIGLVRIVLETGIRQPEAIALYERAGYVRIPPYGEYVDSAATSVCLARTL